jgi:superfamily I DNA and/or RNA helicase
MLFVSVDSQEERQPNGSSHGNPIEANICVQYVNFLINHKGVEPKDIGIISPYTYQQRVILGLLRKDHQPHAIGELVVGSVERLQVYFQNL